MSATDGDALVLRDARVVGRPVDLVVAGGSSRSPRRGSRPGRGWRSTAGRSSRACATTTCTSTSGRSSGAAWTCPGRGRRPTPWTWSPSGSGPIRPPRGSSSSGTVSATGCGPTGRTGARWAGRTHRSFAYRALLDAGAGLVLGSDAPVAPLDPWVAIAAAVHRSVDDRAPWHPEQHLPLEVALAASFGPDGPLRRGRVADLVVLDAEPDGLDPSGLRHMPVAATMLAGRWTHRAGLPDAWG